MTREEVIKIINDDPHLTTEQGKAIMDRFYECYDHLNEEFAANEKKYSCDKQAIILGALQVCFMIGYVYASLELNGEVKL